MNMTLTIITATLKTTATKGRRVKATVGMPGDKESVTLDWDHSFGTDGNHRMAAEALAQKLGWDALMVSGSDGVKGYHNMLGDVTPNCTRQGSINYKAGQVKKVDDAMCDEHGANLHIEANTGRDVNSKYLTVDRRMVRAILTLFNTQNL